MSKSRNIFSRRTRPDHAPSYQAHSPWKLSQRAGPRPDPEPDRHGSIGLWTFGPRGTGVDGEGRWHLSQATALVAPDPVNAPFLPITETAPRVEGVHNVRMASGALFYGLKGSAWL